MIELPDVIHTMIHGFLKLPSSITITNQNIKDNFIDNANLKMLLYDKKQNNTFIDNYKNDLRKLYLLIQKYSYYENEYRRNEPISSILIDLLCTECNLPCSYSTHSFFTNDTFYDLKEIIRLAPESLNSEYGQLRSRYRLSPLDIACNNVHIPLYVIKYIIEKNADMYHCYELNGCKIHILDDLSNSFIARCENLKELFNSKGFDINKMKDEQSIHQRRYREMYG